MNKNMVLNSIVLPILAILVGSVALSPKLHVVELKNSQLDMVDPQASLINPNFKDADKAKVLEDFFGELGSPLKHNAHQFVAVADKYSLDYRLLPSIACMESSCGKYLIPNTYNPFGWGIYGSQYIAFKNYDEAIDVVGKGISENYISKGLNTPEKIAPIYTPPNHYNWLAGVNSFMSKIDEINETQKASAQRT
jgi:hypothetical protein